MNDGKRVRSGPEHAPRDFFGYSLREPFTRPGQSLPIRSAILDAHQHFFVVKVLRGRVMLSPIRSQRPQVIRRGFFGWSSTAHITNRTSCRSNLSIADVTSSGRVKLLGETTGTAGFLSLSKEMIIRRELRQTRTLTDGLAPIPEFYSHGFWRTPERQGGFCALLAHPYIPDYSIPVRVQLF